MSLRRLIVVPLLALAAAAFGPGCLSPTLPLPPPEVPDAIRQDVDSGNWVISGSCEPGALVTVFDEATGMGVVVEDRQQLGHYVVSLPASKCDLAWVGITLGGELSPTTGFVIKPVDASHPADTGCVP